MEIIMSSTLKFELNAEERKDIGKGASRRLRRVNKVPAVVYGAGEPARSLLLEHNHAAQAFAHEAFYSRVLTLKVGKKNEKVILKDLQRHPSKPQLLHIDFLRVRADQKLQMHVPIHFINEKEAPGLKEGGIFSHLVSDLEVSCLPKDLPEYIEVDVGDMKLNQTLHLSDLKLPKGVELVAFAHGAEEHDLPVVNLSIPRVVEETAPTSLDETATQGEGEGKVDAPKTPDTKEK